MQISRRFDRKYALRVESDFDQHNSVNWIKCSFQNAEVVTKYDEEGVCNDHNKRNEYDSSNNKSYNNDYTLTNIGDHSSPKRFFP